MSVIINNFEGAGVYLPSTNKEYIAYLPKLTPNPQPSGFDIAFQSNGDGLADGEVPKGYIPDTTGYTPVAISNDQQLKDFLADNTGKYGYLTASFTTSITYGNGYTLNGILDGCSHTIIVATYRNTSDNYTFSWGGLIDTISTNGICKNLKLINTANYTNTRGNTETNGKRHQRIGLLVGKLTGAVSNCYVTWDGDWPFFDCKYSGNTIAMLGGVCAQLEGGSIINSTVDVKKELTVQCRGNSGINKNWDMWLGGFAGEVNASGASLTNITITGSSRLYNYKSGSGGSGYSDSGLAVANASSTFTVNGIRVMGSVSITSSTGTDDHIGNVIGDTNNCTCNFFLYSSSSWIATSRDINKWMSGGNENSKPNNPCQYAIADDKVGFCHSTDKIYLCPTTLDETAKGVKGTFAKTVIVDGSTAIDTSNVGILGIETPYTLVFDKSAITGNISATYGYYGYVNKEAGTTAGSYKLYYENGTKDYTFINADAKKVDINTMYEEKTIDGDSFVIIKNCDTGYYI